MRYLRGGGGGGVRNFFLGNSSMQSGCAAAVLRPGAWRAEAAGAQHGAQLLAHSAHAASRPRGIGGKSWTERAETERGTKVPKEKSKRPERVHT